MHEGDTRVIIDTNDKKKEVLNIASNWLHYKKYNSSLGVGNYSTLKGKILGY